MTAILVSMFPLLKLLISAFRSMYASGAAGLYVPPVLFLCFLTLGYRVSNLTYLLLLRT